MMLILLAIFAAVVAVLLLGLLPQRTAEIQQVSQDTKRSETQQNYTGSLACKECHEEVYNGWRSTLHPIKFQKANPSFVIGDFRNGKNIEAANGTTIQMKRVGVQFQMDLQPPNDTLQTFRVDYVLGSIWKQRYITQLATGALAVLPVVWNVKQSRWETILDEHAPGYPALDNWQKPEYAFQYQCMGCHTTNAAFEVDNATGKFTTQWTEMGVGCESCHGAGQAHLDAPIREKAGTIINPARLPDPRRAAMICGSCHTRGSSPEGKHAYPVNYQTGDQLTFMFDENPGVQADGNPKAHHQQYNDWQASGHNLAGVACWDCHSPHLRGKSNRFQLKLPGSMLCRSCHEVHPTGVHSLHSVNNCIGCHMPNTAKSVTAGDLRSHRFVVARPEKTLASKEDPPPPNSCNLCHYHSESDPEDLVHALKAVTKPARCTMCHDKDNEELD